jgi:hypothetical protein
MRRKVSEVKNFFTAVFSLFQNLEKPTWLVNKIFLGLFHFLGILPKNGFFGLRI